MEEALQTKHKKRNVAGCITEILTDDVLHILSRLSMVAWPRVALLA